MPKYKEVEAIRVATKKNSKNKSNNKGKRKVDATLDHSTNTNEDVEMEDALVEKEQTMLSLDDMEVELTNAGNTPATNVDKGKGKISNPVKFGELPIIGGKEAKEAQGKKEKDNDKEWKAFFLGT
jgi:uncharacterized protein YdaT